MEPLIWMSLQKQKGEDVGPSKYVCLTIILKLAEKNPLVIKSCCFQLCTNEVTVDLAASVHDLYSFYCAELCGQIPESLMWGFIGALYNGCDIVLHKTR